MARDKLEEQIVDYVIEYKESHYRLAYSYVKNADDALDIVQESIYKAFSSKNMLKNPEYMKTWFYRIVVNTSLDFLKKQKKLIVVDEDFLFNKESKVIDEYQDIDLKSALENLPDHYRSIIILRFFEDLKIDEIAEILDENANTIKTRLYTALKRLRIEMDD